MAKPAFDSAWSDAMCVSYLLCVIKYLRAQGNSIYDLTVSVGQDFGCNLTGPQWAVIEGVGLGRLVLRPSWERISFQLSQLVGGWIPCWRGWRLPLVPCHVAVASTWQWLPESERGHRVPRGGDPVFHHLIM